LDALYGKLNIQGKGCRRWFRQIMVVPTGIAPPSWLKKMRRERFSLMKDSRHDADPSQSRFAIVLKLTNNRAEVKMITTDKRKTLANTRK